MWLNSHRLSRGLSGKNRRESSRRPQVSIFRPRLEVLEDRTLLSPYIVTTTADSGPGSLRDAITQINADTNHALYASPSNPNVDEIDFNITAASDAAGDGTGYNAVTGVATIQPQSALPTITAPVVLNAASQSGYASKPVIVLDGTLAGNGVNGLVLTASAAGSTVQGFAIDHFIGNGIEVDGGGNNVLASNYIGVDATGNSAGNAENGIDLNNSSGNTIRGTTSGAGNIISCNGRNGIALIGSSATGNVVEGNSIGGTNAAGSIREFALPTPNSAPNNINPGPDGNLWFTVNAPRVGRITPQGVISEFTLPIASNQDINQIISGPNGNLWLSVSTANATGGAPTGTGEIIEMTTTGTVVEEFSLPNVSNAFAITRGPDGNIWFADYYNPIIGRLTPSGDVMYFQAPYAIGELITGPDGNLWFDAANEFNDSVGRMTPSGDVTVFSNLPNPPYTHRGLTAGPNGNIWMSTANSPSPSIVEINTIGQVVGVFRDPNGPYILTPGSDGNLWFSESGNRSAASGGGAYIGSITPQGSITEYPIPTLNSGESDITTGPGGTIWFSEYAANQIGEVVMNHGNGGTGVLIDGASGNIIGGTTPAAGNVISGNLGDGVTITGSGASGNVVAGNTIGTNSSGTVAEANATGVIIENGATNNTVGGATTGAGNLISGNSGDGIDITGSGTSGNVVEGNIVGLDATGTKGVDANGNSLGNSLGVRISDGATNNTIGGTTASARNIISNNTGTAGISIVGSASNNLVAGNHIGTDVTGMVAFGNGFYGSIVLLANNNIIGGTTAGARNVMSDGIDFGQGSDGNLVEGNYIGTDATGNAAFITNSVALIALGGDNNTIGGTAPGAGNIISGNNIRGTFGVSIGGKDNLIQGNIIGRGANGNPLPNGTDVYINGSGNVIGGTEAGAGNEICDSQSGNPAFDGYGVYLSQSASSNVISGNDIEGNTNVGVRMDGGAIDNIIGGASPGAGNTISDNGNGGIIISDFDGPGANTSNSDTTGNVVEGNFIGTNASGASSLGNTGPGVLIEDGSSGNTIGGTASGAGNTIAFNTAGVVVDAGSRDSILGNSIHNNNSLGIDLNSANNANDNQAAPVLTLASNSSSSTTVSGTLTSVANTTFRIEFFSNHGLDASGNAEGQTYLGFAMVTTDSNGHATFTATNLAAIPAGQGYLTATATNQSTGDISRFSNYLTAPTSTVLTSSANPSSLNQPVTFTATVSSSFRTPTGSVDFVDTTTNTDLGTVALSSGGTVSVTVSNLALGTHVIKATYAEFGIFFGSSSTLAQQVSYGFSFLPPLGNGLTFALNRTIPIKFQLTDANSNSITSLSAVSSVQVAAVVNGVPGTQFTPSSTNNQGLQSVGNQYLYNWQTKGLTAGTYEIIVTLADGTMHTKTISLTANGSAAGLVTNGSGGTATAGALLGGEVDLYVDNSNGDITSDELARIQDAVNSIDATIAPYGVVINEVSDPTQANVTLNMNTTSSLGGVAQGVLGCTTDADQVTMIQGWSWYAGADPTQVGAGQYDFETAVMHELGHVLGLGHSSGNTSVMYASLATGTANRVLTTADLNVPDDDSGPCALHAAPAAAITGTSYSLSMPAPSSTSVPSSGSPVSTADQLFANFTLVLNEMRNGNPPALSSVAALWQSMDALMLQRLDALLSKEAGAMGVTKDMLLHDLFFANLSASNSI
jgi:streptogramin lyase